MNNIRVLENDLHNGGYGINYHCVRGIDQKADECLLQYPSSSKHVIQICGYDANEGKDETDYKERYVVDYNFDISCFKAIEKLGHGTIFDSEEIIMSLQPEIVTLTVDNPILTSSDLCVILQDLDHFNTAQMKSRLKMFTPKSHNMYYITILNHENKELENHPLITNNYFLVKMIFNSYIYEKLNGRIDFTMTFHGEETFEEVKESKFHDEYLSICMDMSRNFITDISEYKDIRTAKYIFDEFIQELDNYQIFNNIEVDHDNNTIHIKPYCTNDKTPNTYFTIKDKCVFNKGQNKFESIVVFEATCNDIVTPIESINHAIAILLAYCQASPTSKTARRYNKHVCTLKYNDEFNNINPMQFSVPRLKCVKTAILASEMIKLVHSHDNMEEFKYRGYLYLLEANLNQTYEVIEFRLFADDECTNLLYNIKIIPGIRYSDRSQYRHILGYHTLITEVNGLKINEVSFAVSTSIKPLCMFIKDIVENPKSSTYNFNDLSSRLQEFIIHTIKYKREDGNVVERYTLPSITDNIDDKYRHNTFYNHKYKTDYYYLKKSKEK